MPGGHAARRQLRRVLRHRGVHGGAVGQAREAGEHARHPLALQLMLREGHHLARTRAPARCLPLCRKPSVLPCSLTSRRGEQAREHGPTFQSRPMSASEGHAGGNTCWYRGATLQCSRILGVRHAAALAEEQLVHRAWPLKVVHNVPVLLHVEDSSIS